MMCGTITSQSAAYLNRSPQQREFPMFSDLTNSYEIQTNTVLESLVEEIPDAVQQQQLPPTTTIPTRGRTMTMYEIHAANL
jgi:uncharacterized protein YidB (DUF937 family)